MYADDGDTVNDADGDAGDVDMNVMNIGRILNVNAMMVMSMVVNHTSDRR